MAKQCRICSAKIKQSYMKSVLDDMNRRELCFNCNFWYEKTLKKDSDRVVRVNGNHYWIGDEESNYGFRGFGGHRWCIKFFDGRTVVTTNLWHNGVIPQKFRKELPDNAIFEYDRRMIYPKTYGR